MTLKIWLFFITDKKSSKGYTRKFLQTKFLKSKLKFQARRVLSVCVFKGQSDDTNFLSISWNDLIRSTVISN